MIAMRRASNSNDARYQPSGASVVWVLIPGGPPLGPKGSTGNNWHYKLILLLSRILRGHICIDYKYMYIYRIIYHIRRI